MNRYKGQVGLLDPKLWPIVSEPASAIPTYGNAVSEGPATKAYLTVEAYDVPIYGDDDMESESLFKSGTLEQETSYDDLGLDALIYGATTEGDGSVSDGDGDTSPYFGKSYIEPILKKDAATGTKSTVYRAVCLFKAVATRSGIKDSADTKKDSIEFKYRGTTWSLRKCNNGKWRRRFDFSTLADAQSWINSIMGHSSGYSVAIRNVGSGSSTPGNGLSFYTAGTSAVIDFGATDPAKLYDGTTDKTSQIASHKYTISNIAANHDITVIWSA